LLHNHPLHLAFPLRFHALDALADPERLFVDVRR
jgi:hypothetical protein